MALFNKVLCVKKTTKFERLKETGFFKSSYVEDKLLDTWAEAANVHLTVAEDCINAFKQSGRQVKVKQCYQVEASDFLDPDLDLVVSLGGDGTFLKTASMVKNRRLPMLGVNTDPQRSVGCLCNRKVFYDTREYDIEKMFRYIERENFEFFYRQRLLFEMDKEDPDEEPFQQLSLNEIFVAEDKVSKTSVFKLTADKHFLGKFKSSGLIISTGTGSTGWLYSAKRMSEIDVRRALEQLGAHGEPEQVQNHIAQAMSDQTMFSPENKEMYYFVRETCGSRDQFTANAQGYANELEFTSELLEGKVSIDGLANIPITLGETFRVKTQPEYQLKGLRFIV